MGNFLKWVILIIIGIVILRVVFNSATSGGSFFNLTPSVKLSAPNTDGGPEISDDESGDPDEDIDDSEFDLTDLRGELKKIQRLADSKYRGVVKISNHSGARQTNAEKERVELSVDKSVVERVPISDWRLESAISGVSDRIGKGAYLPRSGDVSAESFIFAEAGDRIVISTGRSPIGSSFRVNKCSGYFEQFQDFQPSLSRSCPKPIEDLPNQGVGNEAERCINFVDRLPRCEVYTKTPPQDVSGSCQQYISLGINYNSCVDNHKNDSNFYSGEWRVFLGRNSELWRSKREIIKLIDHEGRVVDAVTY